jgi:hypothetical protein
MMCPRMLRGFEGRGAARPEGALRPGRVALAVLRVVGSTALVSGCGLSADGTAAQPGADSGHDASGAEYDSGGGLGPGDDAQGFDTSSSGDATMANDSSVDGATHRDAEGDGASSSDATTASEGGDTGALGDAPSDGQGTGSDVMSAPDVALADGGLGDASAETGVESGVDTGVPADGGGSDASVRDAGGKSDASSDGGACDLNGTWASRLTIDVTWAPQGLNAVILASGSGQIKQWIKGVRTQTGMSTSDATVVCGIDLPDFQSTAVIGSETYGVRFPDSLFDGPGDGGAPYLPTFTVSGALGGLTPGATYSTTTTAALLGISLAHPTTDPWPSTVSTAVDMDRDGKTGVTIDTAQGSPYSDVPTGIPGLFQPIVRADELDVAIRQVTIVSGTITDCDDMTGTVSIPQISGKAAIDSHVMGCALSDGGDCSSTQASFVDNTQPVFTPSGSTQFQSVRLGTGATCADVRAALP